MYQREEAKGVFKKAKTKQKSSKGVTKKSSIMSIDRDRVNTMGGNRWKMKWFK